MLSLKEFFDLLFGNPELSKALNKKLEINDFAGYKSFFVPSDGDIARYGPVRDSFATALGKMNTNETVEDSPFFFGLHSSLVELSKEINENETDI